jgi:hypothetical protein
MQTLTKEQNSAIKEILKNPNAENRLIELKRYLSLFAEEFILEATLDFWPIVFI